ncbi:MAG TPA: TonB-dependent receptor plug domain-containing protein, partial [Candidatus Synoicihabitans sp.]|nr:TonB-dependent receptor plug domain-containing protein [Candidatus Synoicihabitans sp.]
MSLTAAAACRVWGASPEHSTRENRTFSPGLSGFSDASVILSPLIVSAEKDTGFVAASSLAGGRLATDLKDTPIAYSVITRELIDALMLLDTESALAWSVGAYAPPTNTQNYKFFNFEGGSSVMSRGIQTNAPQRNFFLLGLNADTYSQERIDFARGPNAVLVGTSGLGGVVNGLTKQAQTDKPFRTVAASVGSRRRRRTTLDLNQPIGDHAAMRLNLLWQEADGWRDLTFDERRGIHLAATVNLLPGTRVRAEYEFFEQRMLTGLDSVNDRVSGWDGVTVATAPTASIPNSDSKGVVRNGSATAPYLVYVPGSDPTRVLNWANTWTTTGGAANARVPVGGVPPLSNTALGINGGAIVGSVYDPNLLFARAIAGADFVPPDRNTIISPDAPNIVYRFHTAAAFLEHQQGDHLFFEAAVNAVDSRKTSEYLQTAGLADARIDLNATLPDGRPNPNFKQAYGEGINGHTYFDDRTTEARIAAALVFDETRWGSFRANVIVGGRETRSRTSQTTEVLERDADIRQRPLHDGFLYRYYWNDPIKPFIQPARVSFLDPIAGTTVDYDVDVMIDLARPGNQRFSVTRFGYAQVAGNAKLLHDRLNLIAGLRRDTFDVDTRTLNSDPAAVAHDYPADWNGRTLHYRGEAPNDYWDLTYTPKDAAGAANGPAQPALARPRLNGVPLPQYANDRFRDDYSSPPVSFNTNTVTYGGVAHLLSWLSVFANHAESFAPGISGLTVSGASVPPSLSEGWDVGLRFTLKDGRLSASVSRYGSTQTA